MSEEDFMDDNDDEDFEVTYMVDEEPDIDVILMPKFNFSQEDFVDNYVKLIRKCKNKTQAKEILMKMLGEFRLIIDIQNDLLELQEKAKELESVINAFGIKF